MSPIGFTTFSAALLALFALPVILFYFLKLKRPVEKIPSLFLWQQVLRDNRVNSPFQRFKRNILLLLQLLLLFLLVLAAMQPFWRGKDKESIRKVVILDTSASMAALDKNGLSRLDLLKEKIQKMIEGLLPGQELCLISFAGQAVKLTEFTDNKRILEKAVDRLKVIDVPGNLEQALSMTEALARGTVFEEAQLISDGNLPEYHGVNLSFKLDYQSLPAGGENIGIISLNARRMQNDWSVFVSISGTPGVGGKIEIRHDNQLIDRTQVILNETGNQRQVYHLDFFDFARLEVKLIPDSFDSLAADNIAYIDLPAARKLDVYLAGDIPEWQHALNAYGKINLDYGKKTNIDYDLIISNNKQDLFSKAPVKLFLGIVPDELQQLMSIAKEKSSNVLDWVRGEALLRYVELREVILLESPEKAPGTSLQDFESQGYSIIGSGEHGPLIAKRQTEETLSYFLFFNTNLSTLPYRIGFPVLVNNLLDIAHNHAGLVDISARKTGIVKLPAGSDKFIEKITGPDNFVKNFDTEKNATNSNFYAPYSGSYTLASKGGAKEVIGLSLLSRSETSLKQAEYLHFRELKVAGSQKSLAGDYPFWLELTFAAFILLLIEWWYFQKKPGPLFQD